MALQDTTVEAINLGRKQALLATGKIIAIHAFFDADGDMTDYPGDAVAFTTEYIEGVGYISGEVSTFQTGTAH